MSGARLVGVFDADGGVVGEGTYVIRKLLGSSHCPLCDITHGWNPRGKPSWKKAVEYLSLPLCVVHRNEMDSRTAAVAASVALPTIILLSPRGDSELVTRTELEQCGGDATNLLNLIERKLVERDVL